MKVSADDGRIYLPKKTREKHGTEFQMIEMSDRIILFPVPDDPLEALREEIDTDKSAKELKEEALKTAMELAGE